jgi:hypothetical protein
MADMASFLGDHSPCYPDIDMNQHLDASGSITL